MIVLINKGAASNYSITYNNVCNQGLLVTERKAQKSCLVGVFFFSLNFYDFWNFGHVLEQDFFLSFRPMYT